MSNGFISHKIVQWIFDDIQSLFAFNPRTEGVYALDNNSGDIYLWNGIRWILYADSVIKVRRNRRPQSTQYTRFPNTPVFKNSYTESIAGKVTASLPYLMCDVEINAGNFTEIVNIWDDIPYRNKSYLETLTNFDANGYHLTSSLSEGPMTGSYFTTVSLSLA